MAYGRFFEDFEVGQVFRHWPGRTIGEADSTWFSLLTMNQHPLHSDAHYAETYTQHKQRVVAGPLVFSIVIGMTVADVSGRAIANLEVDQLRHEKPTFIGDTLYAQSRVLDKHESRQGDRGVVTVETTGTNQRGETVCSYVRKVLVPRRNHATMGLGKLPGEGRETAG
jgi:acyl dehydratase